MRDEDQRTRARLAADGSLFDGYHPEMEAVHRRNAARLAAILDAGGWPGRSLVGVQAADAAWLIAQHAIGEPDFMRRCLVLVSAAATRGDADPLQAAMMEDRVRSFEGRPQRYGTQLDWDADGELGPRAVEDPAGVDERRRSVGLGPLADEVLRQRAALATRGPSPAEAARRRDEYEAWARRVGWRKA